MKLRWIGAIVVIPLSGFLADQAGSPNNVELARQAMNIIFFPLNKLWEFLYTGPGGLEALSMIIPYFISLVLYGFIVGWGIEKLFKIK